MTTETRKRIRAYKRMLPELRERVVAVALLLAMSVSMLGSASFAWLTISRRPEVTGVNTTVAANGNLEIALATGTSLEPNRPAESQIGDSSAAQGQSVTAANITWGNLINLSDPSYGLDNLTLRPAQLNTSSLLVNPLYGATYQMDGRVEKLNSDFGFATWQKDEKGNEYFGISNDLGVRAISSVTVKAVGFPQEVYNKRSAANEANLAAGDAYRRITENPDYMKTLATVMGTYMTASLNDDEGLTNPTMNQQDVKNLRDIFHDFIQAYEYQYDAIAKLINYQLFLLHNDENGSTEYAEITVEELKTVYTTTEKLKDLEVKLSPIVLNKVKVDVLEQMLNDYNNLQECYEELVDLYNRGGIKWADSGLTDIVDKLMSTGACTLDGTAIGNISVGNAGQYLDGRAHNAGITNGVLYNFEYINGTYYCYVQELEVSATVKISILQETKTIKANIQTSAPRTSWFATDLYNSDLMNQGAKGTEVAQDTYGLALDLWVRTNASNSYLTLEGNVLTTERREQAMTMNSDSESRPVYTLSRKTTETKTDDEGNEETNEVTVTYEIYPEKITQQTDEPKYYVAASDNTKWYRVDRHYEFIMEEGDAPILKIDTFHDVIGYEGENRVWENSEAWKDPSPSGLTLDATTQGSGSCYVYYADTPEDQARSLELLKSMEVAFVGGDGTLLGRAIMDTERYYAENGRVTVPLVLRTDSTEIGTDISTGEPLYGITMLEKNIPTRITAIVYLDGTKLGNENVLSASDIQGKLNIQFGSSVVLSHAEDESLFNATRTVSATVDKTTHSYDDYKDNGIPMTSRVTVSVNGDEPTSVTAFFIRTISSTQGSRETEMTFQKQADGTWVADYNFTAPGNYVLRSVDLDGQTYDLENRPEVSIEGFTVQNLTMDKGTNHISVMTADSSYSVGLTLSFASDQVEAMPNTVQGRFLQKNGAVNVNFTLNPTTGQWTGTANFISSGEYTLQYLVLDGEYVELPESLHKTASIKLGMKVAVYTSSPNQFPYDPDETDESKINMPIQVYIMDNNGEELRGLQNVHLYYGLQGSSVLERGMNSTLTWDETKGYYQGTFRSKVGVYNFNMVTVGTDEDMSTITYATTAPRFTIQSPNQPNYEEIVSKAYSYNPDVDKGENKGTSMQVVMTDSATATVVAIIRNLGDQKTYEVQGDLTKEENEEQTWSFLIPITQDNKQDGNWQLEKLMVWNYYDEDGNLISADVDENGKLIADGERDDPLEFMVEDHITKAVTMVNVAVDLPETYDHHLGSSATSGTTTIATAEAGFLDSQPITVPTVSIVDFEGAPVGVTNEDGSFTSYISGINFTYDYMGGSDTHGGYTSSVTLAKAGVATITLEDTGDHKTFAAKNNATATYAGTYTPTLNYTIGGKPYSKTAAEMGEKAPTIEVWSKKPSLTVASASTNNGSWSIANGKTFKAHTKSGSTSAALETVKNTYDEENNELTVYVSAVWCDGLGGKGEGLYYNTESNLITMALSNVDITAARTVPKAKFRLSNTGTAFNTANIYLEGENDLKVDLSVTRGTSTAQSFDTAEVALAEVGGGVTLKIGCDEYGLSCSARYLFGTDKTISTITMTDADRNSYTVTLDKPLTIHNPA